MIKSALPLLQNLPCLGIIRRQIAVQDMKSSGISFIPMVTSLIFPVFFQAVGAAVKSSLLTVVRTVVLFVPLGYLFSRLGLNDFWFTFPVTEVITTLVGVFFYRRFMAQQK